MMFEEKSRNALEPVEVRIEDGEGPNPEATEAEKIGEDILDVAVEGFIDIVVARNAARASSPEEDALYNLFKKPMTGEVIDLPDGKIK